MTSSRRFLSRQPLVRRTSEGLTVLELTVAIALVMLIMAPVLAFVTTAQRNQAAIYNSTGAQADARTAINTIARNLRDAEYPADTTYASTNSDMFGATPTSDSIVFYSEVDAVQGSSSTNGTIYQVQYSLANKTLTQSLTPPSCSNGSCTYTSGTTSRVIATDVLNDNASTCSNGIAATSLFSYSQQSVATGQLLTVTDLTDYQSQVNYVDITVITGPTSGTGTCTDIQTSVSLRNWRP